MKRPPSFTQPRPEQWRALPLALRQRWWRETEYGAHAPSEELQAIMSMKPILCVDFDGVIHGYQSGWKGAAVVPDPPVPGALKWLYDASVHFTVYIYSSRSKDPEGITAMRMWFTFHARSELPQLQAEVLLQAVVFAHEKPAAFLTIDDRAICFNGTWAELDPDKLIQFKPWYQKSGQVHSESISENISSTASVTQ